MINSCLAIGDLAYNISLFIDEFSPIEVEQEVLRRIEGIAGAPSFFSVVASQLGMETAILSKVGNDNLGRKILNTLQKQHVDISQVIIEKKRSCLFVSVYDKAFRRKLYFHSPSLRLLPDDINERNLESYDILYIGPTILATSEKLAALGKNQGKIVAFGPSGNFASLGLDGISDVLNSVDFLFLNENEAYLYCKKKNLVKCCQSIANYGVKLIAVTRGAKGCFVFANDNIIAHPGFKVKVVNPTGAGEAFAAGFICKYLETKDVKEATKFANAAGASAVSRTRIVENPPTLKTMNSLMKIENSTGD